MKSNFKILLVEDSEAFRKTVGELLGVYNDVDHADSIESAKTLLLKNTYDVVVLDKGLPDGDGLNLISEIKNINSNTVVIMLTADTDFSSVKHCIARGADDYVIKTENIIPDLLVRIPVAVSKAASNRRLASLEKLVKDAFKYEIIGKSQSTLELREQILSLKNTNAHVLITGESGTGKELIARRINTIEDEPGRPFIAVNCGAISENLIESELFGHKKGSFTGAVSDRIGKFEAANNGDLFLDEIGELPLPMQSKLLRAIQEGEIVRIGENKPIKINCRIIAATNHNIESQVQNKNFREDLFHRINVVRIETTPLRYRNTDISDLAKFFTLQIGGPNFKIAQHAINTLLDYTWPGNIRELRNTIERAVISARRRKSNEILFSDINIYQLPESAFHRVKKIEASLPTGINEISEKSYAEFLSLLHKEYIETSLTYTNGSAEQLASILGLSRSTMFKRIKDFGVSFSKNDRFIKNKYISNPELESDLNNGEAI